ncbi:MAG: tetratricopeptide repeat protein [bacterium]|nr:tetratricopeptide repeat protein [bacterium]
MNKKLIIGASALAALSFGGGVYYGRCHFYSQGLPHIASSFERAANQGSSDIQAIAGVLRAEELGCTYCPDKAHAYWRQAAEKKTPSTLYLEGYACEMGLGTPRDYIKARQIYKQAAQKNHPPALRQLGYMYFYGRGVPENRAQGQQFLHQAAAHGDLPSKTFLANLSHAK